MVYKITRKNCECVIITVHSSVVDRGLGVTCVVVTGVVVVLVMMCKVQLWVVVVLM